jgi:acetylornithine deacetylase/succinyl-diaminopimelate desuccinylase-like protein
MLTVGSILAGTKSNVIPESATLQLNVRTFSHATREAMLAAIRRIVTGPGRPGRPGQPLGPEPTLDTGTHALVAGALAWLAAQRPAVTALSRRPVRGACAESVR